VFRELRAREEEDHQDRAYGHVLVESRHLELGEPLRKEAQEDHPEQGAHDVAVSAPEGCASEEHRGDNEDRRVAAEGGARRREAGAVEHAADDEQHQAKKQQQRKKVTKTAAAADSDAAPKKRGRPAKAKEAAPAPVDDLIQDLVASAKKAATPTPTAKSAPTSPELSEDEVSSPIAVAVVAAKPATAKLSAKPKAAAKPKAPEREEVECDGEKFWRMMFNSEEILVRCSDNLVFCSRDGVGYNIGTWDEKTKTVIEDDEESDEE
jgi:hypothetical protein